ncbi:DNA-binding transcriptional MocR family regulator [Paenibacillus endophyticus]|uniref:DNA-binding transcriptional MocR family regulator n=1 Tax=Paenibacillus endophyticus TaxID=1294268 RepID=A0A7W5CA41_9BACL|nr:PLP-dependent aminotransferase family protein [Paenibacillus endophyticus]MBB3153963.1 DNA-binding transcriptional MocR family regulator [Paenibacillus endophyticus]
MAITYGINICKARGNPIVFISLSSHSRAYSKIGSGLPYSIHVLSKLLEGKLTIGIEAGGFAQVGLIFEQHGFRVIPLSFDCMDHLVTELAANAIQALYVTPSHRPSAKPLPYAARKQLLRWAADNNTYLIEDDYDGDFRYTGKTLPSLQSLDEHGSVVYIGTYSKAFTPALRMNYMVMPPQLHAKLPAIEYALASPSRIDQWAMQLFMERGHWYRHVRKLRNLYRGKHAKLLTYLRCYLPHSLKVSEEAAGLFVEITVNAAVSEDDLVGLAANEDVIVYGPQNLSRPDNSEGATIYLGFGGLTDHEMEQGVQLLARAWSNVFASRMHD